MTENRLSKYALAAGTTIAVTAAGSAHAGIVSSVGPVNVAAGDTEKLFNFGPGGFEAHNRLESMGRKISQGEWNEFCTRHRFLQCEQCRRRLDHQLFLHREYGPGAG